MSDTLPLLIEAQQLLPRLKDDNLLIVDLSRETVYQQAHLPGAVFLDFKQLLAGTAPAPGKLPSEARLSELFSILGLKENTHVLAYDDEGGGWAGRFIWTLDCIGHKHYSYLNGGIHAWLGENFPVEQNSNTPAPSSYQACIREDVADIKVNLDFILQHLATKDMVVWDARSKEEYTGSKVFAAKGGHIPGAKHYEWTRAMDKNNFLRIRDFEQVKKELADSGIDKNKTVVTHCQTHHRSGFTYLLGKILGFNDIRAYDGSWSEWGNHPDTPVETNE